MCQLKGTHRSRSFRNSYTSCSISIHQQKTIFNAKSQLVRQENWRQQGWIRGTRMRCLAHRMLCLPSAEVKGLTHITLERAKMPPALEDYYIQKRHLGFFGRTWNRLRHRNSYTYNRIRENLTISSDRIHLRHSKVLQTSSQN